MDFRNPARHPITLNRPVKNGSSFSVSQPAAKRSVTKVPVGRNLIRAVLRSGFHGNFLGEVGFADLKRAIEPPLGNSPEAGWVFASSAHGKGFAVEAVQAIHIWGANHFQTPNSSCLIDSGNRPSLRLAAKMGYREAVERLQGTTYGHFLSKLEKNLTTDGHRFTDKGLVT